MMEQYIQNTYFISVGIHATAACWAESKKNTTQLDDCIYAWTVEDIWLSIVVYLDMNMCHLSNVSQFLSTSTVACDFMCTAMTFS